MSLPRTFSLSLAVTNEIPVGFFSTALVICLNSAGYHYWTENTTFLRFASTGTLIIQGTRKRFSSFLYMVSWQIFTWKFLYINHSNWIVRFLYMFLSQKLHHLSMVQQYALEDPQTSLYFAFQYDYRTLLRSSSIDKPSDPPITVVSFVFFHFSRQNFFSI